METSSPSSIFDRLAQQLDHFRVDPESAIADLSTAVETAVHVVAGWNSEQFTPEDLSRVQDLSRQLWSAGYLGRAAAEERVLLAGDLVRRDWPGLLGAMMLVPAWQWAATPKLEQVPAWLWAHYVEWQFTAPNRFVPLETVDRYVARLEEMAEALDRAAGANIGAVGVKEAVDTFVRLQGSTVPLRSTRSLRRWMKSRVSLFRKSLRHRTDRALAPRAQAREGRALRVGVIVREWTESLAARSRFAWLAGLPPEEFTLILFCEKPGNDPLALEHRRFASLMHILPRGMLDRVDALRVSDLDVVVHTGTLEPSTESVLAMQRVAPLQIAFGECAWASGHPEIDLHVVPANVDTEEFGGAVGVLRGLGLAWDADVAAPEVNQISRAQFGLPESGPVFVSASSLEALSAETLRTWAELLGTVEGSSLLLLPPAGADTFELEQLLHHFHVETGLSPDRVAVSVGDPRAGFAHGSVYLDTFPLSSPIPVQAALAAGLPVVAWEGPTLRSRGGANALRAAGRAEWIADSRESYVEHARRALVWTRDNRSVHPHGSDFAAVAADLGSLVLLAYDRLATGRRLPAVMRLEHKSADLAHALQAARTALAEKDLAGAVENARMALAHDASLSEACGILARAHLRGGFLPAAEYCAFAGLRGHEQQAERWIEVGQVLRLKKEFSGAISAYEAALRLEPKSIDGWLGIAELAQLKGAGGLAADAVGMARRIDPRDPRLISLGA